MPLTLTVKTLAAIPANDKNYVITEAEPEFFVLNIFKIYKNLATQYTNAE